MIVNVKKEDLERYYIDEKKSMLEISRIYGCALNTIKNKLKKYNISVRLNGAFLVDDDGKTLKSKYNKGEVSANEYNNKTAKNRGYEDSNNYNREMSYERGDSSPMSENKDCPSYLGVHICENKKFLSRIVNIIENMPYGNPGYDIVCIKDKKIDVKCGCLNDNNKWNFIINKNKITDYFLMISFNNRNDLNIEHIWLVKGNAVIEKTANRSEFIFNSKHTITIRDGKKALEGWNKHEITDKYKLGEAQKICDSFKIIE